MQLAHLRAGGGRRPLVLLHGLLGSARNLATLARHLVVRNPDLDAVGFDLTGHGASAPLPPGADADALAADVLDSARTLGLRPPLAVVGHSLGGRVALAMTRRDPAAIGVVTLLDVPPGPLGPGGEVAGVLDALQRMPPTFVSRGQARARLVTAGLSAGIADWLLLNLESSGDGYRWRVDRRALADLHARVAAEDLWPLVEGSRRWRLRCVRGGASAYVGDHDVRRLESAGCPVATIAGAGHFLHVEQAEAVADAVAAALA
jgi:pimeloyl-ACP methyl ester carboxylesterase